MIQERIHYITDSSSARGYFRGSARHRQPSRAFSN